MRDKKDWDKRYEENDLPWDTGRPDVALTNLLAQWPKCTGRVLDIGCGTGTNAVWLTEQGFEVTALDISTSAIAMAKKRCAEHNVRCQLLADNFLTCSLDAEQFDLIFDRGCFHSMNGDEELSRFVQKAASCLNPGGLWFSLIGNKDQVVDEKGPPRMSAAEICSCTEPAFEILHLTSILRDTARDPIPLRFWQCLMRLR
ncbi:MAG: class I SAM-dependent methyltransferase [Candidatus Electrothrix sp. AR4]|nr:class I SAM-dependent methyltransferase [Candidatus Electrothrix sp. AR4]